MKALDVIARQWLGKELFVGIAIALKVKLIEQILNDWTQLFLGWVDAKLVEQIGLHLAEPHLVALLFERLADVIFTSLCPSVE